MFSRSGHIVQFYLSRPILSLSRQFLPRVPPLPTATSSSFPPSSSFHHLSLGRQSHHPQPTLTSPSSTQLLVQPRTADLQHTAGLKYVGVPKLRCRHCYFVVQDETRYVMCTSKPRHRQAQKMKYKKYGDMIMTHATQGGYNHGNGKGRRDMLTQSSFRLDF